MKELLILSRLNQEDFNDVIKSSEQGRNLEEYVTLLKVCQKYSEFLRMDQYTHGGYMGRDLPYDMERGKLDVISRTLDTIIHVANYLRPFDEKFFEERWYGKK